MAIRNIKKIALRTLAVALSILPVQMAWANAFSDPGEGRVGFANLLPVQKEIRAGVATIGSTSYVVALFKNNGGQPVTVDSLNLYPSSNVSAEVSLNQCSLEPLPPNAECAITMAISPLKVGEWRVEILVNHSGQSRLAIASLVGQVKRAEQDTSDLQLDVQAIPETLDFGKLENNVPLTRSITFRNTTSRLIDVYRLDIEAPKQAGFELISDCAELASGQTCVATIKWKPQSRGNAQGVIVLEHSGASRINRVEVKGEYLPIRQNALNAWPEGVPGRGLLIADRTSIDFGTTVAGPSAITISLANMGDAPIKLDNIALVGTSNGLSLARTGCFGGITLNQSEACPVTINWQPLRQGAILDDLVIRHDGVRSVLVLPVRGAATEAGVANSQAAIRTTALQGGTSTLGSANISTSTGKVSAAINLDAMVGDEENKDSLSSSGASVEGGATGATAESKKRTQLSLDGFAISSLSNQKAVIRGPSGSLVVRNGQERVFLAGLSWAVEIEPFGVRLFTDNEESLIFFDPFLRSAPGVATAVGASNLGRGNNSADAASAQAVAPTATPAPAPVDSGAAMAPMGGGI
jgi:hypothetical protein